MSKTAPKRSEVHKLGDKYFKALKEHLETCDENYKRDFHLSERLAALNYNSDILSDEIIDHGW